jgi:hypothetical protein
LCAFTSSEKTLANATVEPAILSLAVPVAALIRVAVGSRTSGKLCVAGLIAAVSIVAFGIFFLVPVLPE